MIGQAQDLAASKVLDTSCQFRFQSREGMSQDLANKKGTSGKLPRYEQIASRLIRDIRSGTTPIGSRLPSEAELQEQFSVSRVTIRQALSILEYQGWIERFRRRGSFVTANGTDSPIQRAGPNLKVIQFLHSGFDKSSAHPFSRGEVEAAEQYYAQQGAAVAWNALDFRSLLSDETPPAVRTGVCSGILLDGHLTPLHVDMIKRWNKPFVVLGEHDFNPGDLGVNHVGMDIVQSASLIMEAVQRLRIGHLLILDNALQNAAHRGVLMELDRQLAKADLPPLSLRPLEAAAAPGFLRSVDRIHPRCGIMVSSMELTGIFMAVMQDDPNWKRHPFIAQGSPFPARGPHLDFAAWIELSPRELVEAGCQLLDRQIENPSLIPEQKRLTCSLRIPEDILPSS